MSALGSPVIAAAMLQSYIFWNTRYDAHIRVTDTSRAGDGPNSEPSVSPPGGAGQVDTKDDIKFIWNGRVLSTTEELYDVCTGYFGKNAGSKRDAQGKGSNTGAVPGGPCPDNKVLILHAVVRPPGYPMKRKGKKSVDGAGAQTSGVGDGDGMSCQCCAIQ